jgi:tetratricopeptide (TPR) repeat protein
VLALGGDIADFADTAAIVTQLDLIICVDTAIAHLAGALNKPCWVLLQANGTDWRWQHERSDSPWYPDVIRLFRQSTPGAWYPTIAEVATALRALCGEISPVPTPRRQQFLERFRENRLDECRDEARELTRRYPQDAFAWNALGVCLSMQSRYAEAVAPLRQAVALSREDGEPCLNLAIALKQLGDRAGALDAYSAALSLNPDDPATRQRRASLLREMNRPTEAEADYRLILNRPSDGVPVPCRKLPTCDSGWHSP